MDARLAQRFWSFVGEISACWLWTGRRGRNGYGQLSILHKKYGAHRVSYELNIGPIPAGLCVLHRCDTPACVNPRHLFLGTHADNVADMLAKGRARPFGADRLRFGHPRSTLTAAIVHRIRALRESGLQYGEIAATLSIGYSATRNVCIGRTWSWLKTNKEVA